jgi:hypothetical protein
MKATLEFNLPEDQIEFDLAINGGKWSLCMWELDQHLRSQTKYAPDTISGDTYQALIDTRDKLHEIMTEHGLKFD